MRSSCAPVDATPNTISLRRGLRVARERVVEVRATISGQTSADAWVPMVAGVRMVPSRSSEVNEPSRRLPRTPGR